jgi:hypothetical protein
MPVGQSTKIALLAERRRVELGVSSLPAHLVNDSPLAESSVNRGEDPLRGQAQHRTRTDDPFLTMEVLYQLS